MKPKKKRVFITKSAKKQFLLEFWCDNQYLGSLGPQTALQWQRACYFLWGTILACGAQFLFGGHKQWFGGGHGPGMLPVASGLLQVYSNLSNCNYRIFVKEILLEIGFIKEIRTIWGNKEVPQTFFRDFLCLWKYDLFVWLRTIVNPAFAILWHYKRHNFAKILTN